MDEERPVHHECNIATGETVIRPFTDEEWTAHRQRAADAEQQRASAEAEEAKLRAAVAAHPDPLVKALAARLGLTGPSAGGV